MGTSRKRELERYGGISAAEQPDRTVVLKDMQQYVLEDSLPPMIEEAVSLLKQKQGEEETAPPPETPFSSSPTNASGTGTKTAPPPPPSKKP